MKKELKTIVSVYLAAFCLSACASFGDRNHDNEWHRLESQYRKDCEVWTKKTAPKRLIVKAGEQYLTVKDIIARRCAQNPELCNAPKKPDELRYYEEAWGEPVTGDYCSSYHYDEDRLKVNFKN